MGALSDCSDEDLIARVAKAEREDAYAALDEIYRRHAAPVFRFASMIATSKDAASDAMQEAFIWLAGPGAHKFDAARGSLVALLCGVARNHVLRIQTSDSRLVFVDDDATIERNLISDHNAAELPAHAEDGFAALDRQSREAALHAAIRQLPCEFREVIVLIEFEEFSYESAAAIIGCPIGTVRSRLSRARARLKESLAELFLAHEGNAV